MLKTTDVKKSESMIGVYPLTSYQKDIWLEQCLYPERPIYNIGGYCEVEGDLNYQIFQKAMDMVIENNSILRARIVEKDEEYYQKILPRLKYKVPFYNFSGHENASLDWMNNSSLNPLTIMEICLLLS